MENVADEFVADLVAALRSGHGAQDEEFDRLLKPRFRTLSRIHWSPLSICVRAAEWLGVKPESRVLDIGSGVGKLCVVGSLLSDSTFIGVERREHLVTEARALADLACAPGAHFVCDDAFNLDWSEYDALYFYNPFGELEVTDMGRIDSEVVADAVELKLRRDETVRRLAKMPLGTRVAVFHGFGSEMPRGYSLLNTEWTANGPLELWMQTAEAFSPMKGRRTP